MSAVRISRRGLGELMVRRPEVRFSVSPLVNPAWPENITVYGWRFESGSAQLHGYYEVCSHLPHGIALVLVEAQIREAGRRFDVAGWELARRARLRPVAA